MILFLTRHYLLWLSQVAGLLCCDFIIDSMCLVMLSLLPVSFSCVLSLRGDEDLSQMANNGPPTDAATYCMHLHLQCNIALCAAAAATTTTSNSLLYPFFFAGWWRWERVASSFHHDDHLFPIYVTYAVQSIRFFLMVTMGEDYSKQLLTWNQMNERQWLNSQLTNDKEVGGTLAVFL